MTYEPNCQAAKLLYCYVAKFLNGSAISVQICNPKSPGLLLPRHQNFFSGSDQAIITRPSPSHTHFLEKSTFWPLRPLGRSLLKVDPERAFYPCFEKQGLGAIEGSISMAKMAF